MSEVLVSDERNPWDQLPDEPDLWYGRFMAFLRMGTKRSVNAVFKKETTRNHEKPREKEAPGDWYDIEKVWRWKERAKAYDEYVRAEEDRVIAEEREKVLRSGFALQHKRVKELDKLTRKLIRMAGDESKVWIPEIRTFQSGKDTSSTVEKMTFNDDLFSLIDKYLGSIAAEMGERVKKKDVTLTELPPNVYTGFDPDQDGVDE